MSYIKNGIDISSREETMNKKRIDNLLQDIQKLEKQIAGMQNDDFYLISSFSHSFDLAHKILVDIHSLEIDRVDTLRQQLEEHQRIINSISSLKTATPAVPSPQPEPTPEPIPEHTPEIKEETISEMQETVIEKTEIIQEVITHPEPTPLVTEQPAPVINPIKESEVIAEKKATVFLSEILEKNSLSDFRKAFSLNDRFRFKRQLFDGDEETMNKAIADLNDIHTYEESIAYLQNQLNWHIEEEAATDFIKLLEKRFL